MWLLNFMVYRNLNHLAKSSVKHKSFLARTGKTHTSGGYRILKTTLTRNAALWKLAIGGGPFLRCDESGFVAKNLQDGDKDDDYI